VTLLKQIITSEFQLVLVNRILISAVITVVAVILQKLGKRAIKRGFERAKRSVSEQASKKLDTTRSIILGLFKYSILVIAIVLVFQTFKVDLSSILTLAGIGGIAVGIGAQSLIKDILNGTFIWFENQFSVGDMITVADRCGRVVDFNLRTTKLVDEAGELYIIPNSEIRVVKNSSKKKT